MLIYSPEYSTGISQLDADHRQLIDTLNDLEAGLAQSKGSKQVGAILERLRRYADVHFTREESCMNRYRCPVAGRNRAAHDRFRARLTEAIERLEGPGNAAALIARQVHRELSDWIVNHILRVDCELKQCVGSAKSKPREP